MALYGSAKAPRVPKYGTGTKVVALANQDVTGTPTQTTINAAINAVVARLNVLIDHLNDGKV
jgi:hypothetical protein